MAHWSTSSAARFSRGLAAAAIVALAGTVLAAPAFAQQPTPAPRPPAQRPATPAKPPAAPAKPAEAQGAELQPGQPNPWVKLCSKDQEKRDVCLVTQELRTEQGQVVGSVAIREIGSDAKKMMVILVPPEMLIQPGLRIGVDKGKREEAKYVICFTNACFAEMPVSDQFIAGMKKGQVLVVTTLTVQEKQQNFPFTLAGFKQSHEGPGIDPTTGQTAQANPLDEALQRRAEEKRAEELRQRLSNEKPKQP